MDITWDDQLSALQQISQRKLINILDLIKGKKDLIIEQSLMKILDSFIGAPTLREYGVDKIFKFEEGLKPSNSQRVFINTCDLIACKRVLNQIQIENSQLPGLSHHMLIAPFVPVALEIIIEEEGLAGLVELHPLAWEFVRLDDNVLSLEVPMFNDLFYHKDTQLLAALARSLWSLILILGTPNNIIAVGKHSHKVIDMIDSMKGFSNQSNQLGTVIVMDRTCDLVSLLLTPVTYLGLMGEVVDIKAGVATLNNSQIKLDPKKDLVYAEVRDRHFNDAFLTFRTKAKSLKLEQQAVQAMEINEMKHYVANTLQKTATSKKQLEFHISVSEAVVNTLSSEFEALHRIEQSALENSGKKESLDYIEKNIDDNPLRSIRLLSLLSLTNDGLTMDEVQNIQKSHLHAHGFKNIPLFYKLINVGLLNYKTDNVLQKLPSRNSKWYANAKRLKLLPKPSLAVDLKGPTCPSYVFNGAYIPSIAQLLNIVVSEKNSLTSNADLANTPDCIVKSDGGLCNPKRVLICIVGGITYGEISACRLVEKSAGIQLVIASDNIITGNKLIQNIQNI